MAYKAVDFCKVNRKEHLSFILTTIWQVPREHSTNIHAITVWQIDNGADDLKSLD